jgi:hypothetical protein
MHVVVWCVHGCKIPDSILSSLVTVLDKKLVGVLALFDQPKGVIAKFLARGWSFVEWFGGALIRSCLYLSHRGRIEAL